MMQNQPDPIAQPVLNTPYEHPARHWKLDETGRALPEVIPGRRPSIGLIPVPKARKKLAQGELVLEEGNLNDVVNSIRHEVGLWRDRDYPGVTKATRNLLNHWKEERTRLPLFFAQREAAETMGNSTGGCSRRPELLAVKYKREPSGGGAFQLWQRDFVSRSGV